MKNNKRFIALLPLLVFSADLLAVSLVETQREEGQDITYVDGHRMLIESAENDFRMVMDLEKKKSYMINTREKTAMDMSEATWKALKAADAKKQPPKVDARLEKVGDGPEIAGYKTIHYKVHVDGHVCAEKWASVKALADSGYDEVWDEYGDFLVSASVDADSHPCELADYQVFRDDKHGLALKEIDHNCETSEILRIERGVDLDRSLFELPSGYRVIKLLDYAGSLGQGQMREDGAWSWGRWEGMDCSEQGVVYGMQGQYFDEGYADEEYADEEYAEEEYAEEEYAEEDLSGEDRDVEVLSKEIKGRFKGLMGKFKKKDKDDND